LRILGVRVDCVGMTDAVAAVDRLVESGNAETRLVATVNPEFIMRARVDEQFRQALEEAALCLPDGAGVVWALRRQGCRGQDRVPGVELVEALAATCGRRGWRPFLLGAAPGVAAEAARRLEARVPGLRLAGVHTGSPRPADDADTLRRIHAARPDLLFVAYGHPQQELWIARNRQRLGVPVAIGVGGAFDFLSGRVPRAPRWVRRAQLEWLWRLTIQPWRARRMAVLPVYALAVLRGLQR
jgi:N-acetylglucosaminyldiphosphoundecaprenol N-acetyl-beta-D-mannosaminyltransferase